MRIILNIFLLASINAYASFTPLSGTFSNANNKNYNLSFNLIVTSNSSGQQVSLQCINNQNASFFHIQHFDKQATNFKLTNIKTCPFAEVNIQLDYEEAYLIYNKNKVMLVRGNIYVPIKD